ncbi:hypothetical protein LY78DRAFT_398867 [Colletotrichum sublineola]|nr:hypothetical protein LY78DRAFT_398867 [Colletotrichum sublineola]
MDKDWDDIQGSVRTQMSNYANAFIRNSRGRGRNVNKENGTRFAADVLLSVRARFYADVAQDAVAAIAAGQPPVVDPSEGPFTQKLALENIKWGFDMKIKRHTEPYRKESFFYDGGDNNRFYGFEGVIQHYAAKHTKALSLDNLPSIRSNHHSSPMLDQQNTLNNTSHAPQNHVGPERPTYSTYDALGRDMPIAPSYHILPRRAPPPSYAPQPVTRTYCRHLTMWTVFYLLSLIQCPATGPMTSLRCTQWHLHASDHILSSLFLKTTLPSLLSHLIPTTRTALLSGKAIIINCHILRLRVYSSRLSITCR